jgi:cytochrome P450
MNTRQVFRTLILPFSNSFQGWLIPKGTWVQGNVWAIHHHEREFPDPDRFNPNRYLKGDPKHRPFPNERGYMTFGWGRRVCSGQGLAEQGTFITIARLLWAFNIWKALGPDGKEIPVDIFDYTSVIFPFERCRTDPRIEMA